MADRDDVPGVIAPPPLVAGTLGGLLATWTTFAPSFVWIFAGAPYVEALRHRPALDAALAALFTGRIGMIATLAACGTAALALHYTGL
jgi:chromate transporter